jgi:hypothetical protein
LHHSIILAKQGCLSIRSTAGRLGHELIGVAGFKPAMSKKEINIQLEKNNGRKFLCFFIFEHFNP